MISSFHPTTEDVQSFAVASVVVAICFWAFKSAGWTELPYYLLLAGLTIISREIGQRMVAQWMDAYIDLKTSVEGSATSLFGAFLALITGLPIILLFPLTSSFSGRKYEHWGKSIDAIWAKRQYWLTMGGLTTLFAAWYVAYLFEQQLLAEVTILFMFFQLLPFNYEAIPTSKLDGVYILLWSGFTWLTVMGITLIALVLTFF